jgi:hypothetical protein
VAALHLELLIPFAHAGHWAVQLAYAAPVIGLLVWLGIVKVREARQRRRG